MDEPTDGDTQSGLRAGSRFGHYRLRRLLGEGGFGQVWEAEDTAMDRAVALKLLKPAYSDNENFRQRLYREARAAGRLNEPHVVPIHQCGEIDGQLYIDMRLVKGTDLQTVLARNGPLSPARAAAVVRQIAAALDAAHSEQMVHRDIKPANILLTGDDFACLVDFGLANAATDAKLTSSGTTIGTFAYMSPERFSNAEVSHRAGADIYSLACVLYECLTGSPPYAIGDLPALINAHLTAPIPRPSQHRPQIPAAFDDVIARGMAKKPEDRYASAGELARAAHGALSGPAQHHADTILDTAQAGATRDRGQPAATPRPKAAIKRRPPSPGPKAAIKPRPPSPGPKGAAKSRPPSTSPPAATRPRPPASSPTTYRPSAEVALLQRLSRRPAITPLALAVLVLIAVTIAVIVGYRSLKPPAPSSRQPVELPFASLLPLSVAVDTADNVYVTGGATDQKNTGRVVKLAAGTTTPVDLPSPGVDTHPSSVAVDSIGNVYVADWKQEKVLKLPAGSNTWADLPFTGLTGSNTNNGLAVAADSAGNVYVTDAGSRRVIKLAAGSNTSTELPFTELSNPSGVAVDGAGNVYVSDAGNNVVFKLAPGAAGPPVQLPFTNLHGPLGAAVDRAGNVYIADSGNVIKLPTNSNAQTNLPFSGLKIISSVAVDAAGNVFVTDVGSGRVLKLPAG